MICVKSLGLVWLTCASAQSVENVYALRLPRTRRTANAWGCCCPIGELRSDATRIKTFAPSFKFVHFIDSKTANYFDIKTVSIHYNSSQQYVNITKKAYGIVTNEYIIRSSSEDK